ncbi:hypothetical protein FHX42_005267 [Saccharopolyspora lacisalsi]|uniref:Metal-dependent hydrolase n=1 Tax=Halosaccharopolyspora lacisalsi TaxID=1000566 RepID=A0A839E494_9PSEU|nr:metal-dependent hydrolase [Halosaccharopolyspora lacisalsi]MBA8827860.1 hypothetical protein [Halosaccharopolyspora lacisalsi]
MLGRSHITTGCATGGVVLAGTTGLGYWLVPGFTGLGAGPWISGLILAAGASLLPDLDTTESTAYHAVGPATARLGNGCQRLSRRVYVATAGPADSPRPRVHRGLLHTPTFAGLVGVLCALAVLVTPWTVAPLLFLCGVLTLKGLHRSLPSEWIRAMYPLRSLREVFQWFYAAGVTAALLGFGSIDRADGIYLGLCLAVGMVTHDLGDACTNSAVPMTWPKQRDGKRWTCSGLPPALRFSTGEDSLVEAGVRRVSLTVAVLLIAGTAVLPPAWPLLVDWLGTS